MKFIRTAHIFIFLLLSFLLLPGNEGAIARNITNGLGTLAVYLYQPTTNPQDISFTVKKLEIKQQDGTWVNLASRPISIKPIDIENSQVLLAESRVDGGKYIGLRMQVADASVAREENRFSLALPQPGNMVEINMVFSMEHGESTVLFLNWYPNRSIEKKFLFRPFIKVESQKLSPQAVLLYVANSGSNYVSVVDRFENRVVAIIGVEEGPTGLALSEDQEKLYVLNSRSGSVSIIDTTQDFARDRIQLISGIDPIEMALMPDINGNGNGKLYITNKGSNDITVVDTNLKSQIDNIRVRSEPLGIVANQTRQEVYVANSGSNSISVINSLTDTVVATINVDSNPLDVAIVNDSLYVINGRSSRITVIDVVSKKITGTIPSGANPRKAIYSEQFDRVYLASYRSGQISFLIPSLNVITRSIDVGMKPIGLAIDESRNRLYVTDFNSNHIAVVNPVSEVVEKKITVGKKPYGIVMIK